MSTMSTKQLKKSREAAGVSARELSRRLGKNVQYIASLEARADVVPDHMVDAIKAALRGDEVQREHWVHENDEFDAARLSRIITERNLNCSQLARDIGVSRPTLYNAMQGTSKPSREVAESIAAALGIAVDVLYGYRDAAETTPVAAGVAAKQGMTLVKMNKKALDILKEVLEGVEGVEWRCL